MCEAGRAVDVDEEDGGGGGHVGEGEVRRRRWKSEVAATAIHIEPSFHVVDRSQDILHSSSLTPPPCIDLAE